MPSLRGKKEAALRSRIKAVITAGRSFLIVGHRNPDGDALGSALAVRLLLLGLGKTARVWIPEGVPRCYRFLPGADGVATSLKAAERFDATIAVDSADEGILAAPLPPAERRGPVIVLDHHSTRKEWGDVYLYAKCAAVGELVFALCADYPEFKPDRAFAECIYAAILTDSGSFHYETTTPAVMRVAARCLELGVSPWEMSYRIFEGYPREKIDLLRDVLATLEVDLNGRFATLTAAPQLMEKHRLGPDALEDFINYARGIEGVEVAAMLRRRPDGAVRVSFRSRGRINVAEVARQFDGGGHPNASGCTFSSADLTFEQVRQIIRDYLESAYRLSTLAPAKE